MLSKGLREIKFLWGNKDLGEERTRRGHEMGKRKKRNWRAQKKKTKQRKKKAFSGPKGKDKERGTFGRRMGSPLLVGGEGWDITVG